MKRLSVLLLRCLMMAVLLRSPFSVAGSAGHLEAAQGNGLLPVDPARTLSTSQALQPLRTVMTGKTARLTPRQPELVSHFGHAIAIDGNTAVIGAPRSEAGRGAVYIFVRQGESWRETSRLVASDRAANDAFGQSVSISGATIAVGASGHDALGYETGAVYVFRYDQGNWVQSQKLLPASPHDVRFGWSVAIAGQTMVVGAPYRYSQGEMNKIGSATIYANKGQGWQKQARLTSRRSGGAANSDLFGWAVAVQESTVAIGAHLAEAVYLYQLSNGRWQQEMVLRGKGPKAHFGYSVSLANGLLAIGAPAANQPAMRSGAAYVYVRQANGWSGTAQINPGSLPPGSRFGWSVALQDDRLVVGARESRGRTGEEQAGGVYIFHIQNDTPLLIEKIFASNPAPFDHFGHAVAISADSIVVGAPGRDIQPGSIHIIGRE